MPGQSIHSLMFDAVQVRSRHRMSCSQALHIAARARWLRGIKVIYSPHFGPGTFGPRRRLLTARDTRMLHISSRRWLRVRLAQPHDGPTVIVTHHAPLIRTRPPLPVQRALAGAFASDVTDLMGADRVALWIFGHTHRVADLELRGTRIVSNPSGYPHQPVAGFDPARVIELGARR